MKINTLFKKLKINPGKYRDLHIFRFYSSFVAVSNGKIIGLTEPYMIYCPLANYLYKGLRCYKKNGSSLRGSSLKLSIRSSVEQKIDKFGFFTNKREIIKREISVPFGASEILMYCLKKKIIDAAVVVCDGAGTVIVNKPEIVQGIGARMNGLFYTTPIPAIMTKLLKNRCNLVSPDAEIDQIKGVETAASLGYKKIAVTVNGCMENDLMKLKNIVKAFGVKVTTLIVCTTGMRDKSVKNLFKYSDLVWSCASDKVRKIIGKKSILQLSKAIPVFVLTKKGLDLVKGYLLNGNISIKMRLKKQYLISSKKNNPADKKIRIGNIKGYLREVRLPIRSDKEPKLLKQGIGVWKN
ncbi:MAG: DUF2099 family protein [Endomicrobiales bacterium]|nr:DUF2099 family protein [Endomicrobiales bacterium]